METNIRTYGQCNRIDIKSGMRNRRNHKMIQSYTDKQEDNLREIDQQLNRFRGKVEGFSLSPKESETERLIDIL